MQVPCAHLVEKTVEKLPRLAQLVIANKICVLPSDAVLETRTRA
jgi:hypothetical protein